MIVAVTLGACGDNLEVHAAGETTSGTRVKLARYVFADGTSEVATDVFHDAARDEACRPTVWSDGQTYCTPEASEAVYTEAGCTTLIGRASASEPAPRYFVRTYTLPDGERASRLFVAGDAVAAPALYWRWHDGACFGPEAAREDDRFHELAHEVPRDELVRVLHAVSTEPSRLAVTSLTTHDGLRVPVELSDRELDVRCELVAQGGGETAACIPHGAREASYFADAACSIAELEVARSDATPPIAWQTERATACTQYFTLGELVIGPRFRMIAGTCQPATAPSDAAFYRLGAAFEPATLARRRTRGGDRLDHIEVGDGALALRAPRFHDRELGTGCARAIVDGEPRCAPVTDALVLARFADPACSAELLLVERDTRACAPRPSYARGTGYHAIGAAHVGPVYWWSTGDRCVPYVPPEAYLTLHEVGPPLPSSALATAALVVDP